MAREGFFWSATTRVGMKGHVHQLSPPSGLRPPSGAGQVPAPSFFTKALIAMCGQPHAHARFSTLHKEAACPISRIKKRHHSVL